MLGWSDKAIANHDDLRRPLIAIEEHDVAGIEPAQLTGADLDLAQSAAHGNWKIGRQLERFGSAVVEHISECRSVRGLLDREDAARLLLALHDKSKRSRCPRRLALRRIEGDALAQPFLQP